MTLDGIDVSGELSKAEKAKRVKNQFSRSFLNKEWFVVLAAAVVTFAVCVFHNAALRSFYIYDDEFTIYATAAFFSGRDWSGIITAMGQYYSYGYALLLTPLYWIFDSATVIVRCVNAFNSLIIAGIVPLAYYLLKQWGYCGKGKPVPKLFFPVLLTAALPAAAIAYSAQGVGECMLIFLGFALTALFYKVKNAPPVTRWRWCALLGFLLVYIYTVHQRSLGVTLAGLLTVLLMILPFGGRKSTLSRCDVLAFLSVFTACFVAHIFIKQYLIDNLYHNMITANDYGNVIESVTFSLDTLTKFLIALGGQFWYLGMASFLLVIVACRYLFGRHIMLLLFWLDKKRRRVFKRLDLDFAITFMFAAFIATALIAAFFLRGLGIDEGRADHIVYGRYNDIIYNVVILFIITKLLNGKFNAKRIFIGSAVLYFVLFLGVFFLYNTYGYGKRFLYFCSVNMVPFSGFTKIGSDEWSVWLMIAAFIAFLGGILFFVRRDVLRNAVPVVGLLAFSLFCGNVYLEKTVMKLDDSSATAELRRDLKDGTRADLPMYWFTYKRGTIPSAESVVFINMEMNFKMLFPPNAATATEPYCLIARDVDDYYKINGEVIHRYNVFDNSQNTASGDNGNLDNDNLRGFTLYKITPAIHNTGTDFFGVPNNTPFTPNAETEEDWLKFKRLFGNGGDMSFLQPVTAETSG